MIEATVITPSYQYPCLMRNRQHGYIVLFTAPGTGTVLQSTTSFRFGYWQSHWTMAYFEDFDGILSLKNKRVA